MSSPRLGSLLVLTEDGAATGHATIVAIVKRMLQLVVPDYQTHRIGFEPKDERAQGAVQGTGWKDETPKHYAELNLALRTIATKLGREDGFVLFHIDGDRPWSRRDSSENVAKFETIVVARVRQLLRGRPGGTPEDAEARLRRLFPIVPFYSIEAWLFQHTEVAVRLCRERHKGRDIGTFESWKRDRTAIDEVVKPKDSVCLGSAHNLECAGSGYPAQEVFEAGRSYAICVERLRACVELNELLDATAGRKWGL
ncbi:MAG: hypothetical protein ACMG6S_31560 [Byssovorax sp.]